MARWRELARRSLMALLGSPAVVHVTVDGGHDLPTWRRLLPEWLAWAYPGEGNEGRTER